MANRIVSVHAGIYGMGIYVIMLHLVGSRSLIEKNQIIIYMYNPANI